MLIEIGLFEDNIIFQSYFVTVLIHKEGFYLNCYPYKDRVIDFGKSERWCDDLDDEIKGLHS